MPVMGEQSMDWRCASEAYSENPNVPMKSGTDYFDFGPSEKAYMAYLNQWESLYKQGKSSALAQLRRAIGHQQFHWPAHFACEMTTPDRPLHPPDNVHFNQAQRPSSTPMQLDAFYKWAISHEGVMNIRGDQPWKACTSMNSVGGTVDEEALNLGAAQVPRDLSAMHTLWGIRVKNIQALREQAEMPPLEPAFKRHKN